MILNVDQYQSISSLPISVEDIESLLVFHPSISSHPLKDIVWEYNRTYNFLEGSLTVEVLLRLELPHGLAGVTIEARVIRPEIDELNFIILNTCERPWSHQTHGQDWR